MDGPFDPTRNWTRLTKFDGAW